MIWDTHYQDTRSEWTHGPEDTGLYWAELVLVLGSARSQDIRGKHRRRGDGGLSYGSRSQSQADDVTTLAWLEISIRDSSCVYSS